MLVWPINKEKYATIFNREWNWWPCASIVNIINSPFILFHRILIFREDRPYSLWIMQPSENKTKVTIFLHRGCQAAIPFLCKRGTRSWIHKNWEWRYYSTDTVTLWLKLVLTYDIAHPKCFNCVKYLTRVSWWTSTQKGLQNPNLNINLIQWYSKNFFQIMHFVLKDC